MFHTFLILCLIIFGIYIFFAFGFPKIVSLYISNKFKAEVSISKIDLIRRQLKKIKFVNKNSKLNLCIQSVKLTTNFFETCSSLLTLKIVGLEAKIVKDNSSNQNGKNIFFKKNFDFLTFFWFFDTDEEEERQIFQKIVSLLAMFKFLVTFSFENVHVYVEGRQFATVSVAKADFYTETTRSGFLNLVAELGK